MKHQVTKTHEAYGTVVTYGERKHGCYYATVATDENKNMWVAINLCDEEGTDAEVAAEFGLDATKWELRQAVGRMMQRLCEGGYHVAAVHLLADLVQDVA